MSDIESIYQSLEDKACAVPRYELAGLLFGFLKNGADIGVQKATDKVRANWCTIHPATRTKQCEDDTFREFEELCKSGSPESFIEDSLNKIYGEPLCKRISDIGDAFVALFQAADADGSHTTHEEARQRIRDAESEMEKFYQSGNWWLMRKLVGRDLWEWGMPEQEREEVEARARLAREQVVRAEVVFFELKKIYQCLRVQDGISDRIGS
ncbi:hypothetical protein BU26DRAFT_521709 [Trematosphaeria pertusa]|uniref:Uncharacterized protein n=1 Tax=Trematosphaeria pertusa TaxID=390896 RepID=A0A6A6I7S2_9PLEO|nr:uncharacterized protein BU26DRAFT_521709 [Trematosphaeria pertusa]KAF2246259.1 hypothetical protein BU26DRAFT_521709 [Trematosphaeria pertusa]